VNQPYLTSLILTQSYDECTRTTAYACNSFTRLLRFSVTEGQKRVEVAMSLLNSMRLQSKSSIRKSLFSSDEDVYSILEEVNLLTTSEDNIFVKGFLGFESNYRFQNDDLCKIRTFIIAIDAFCRSFELRYAILLYPSTTQVIDHIYF
jgi:hypothetical protein